LALTRIRMNDIERPKPTSDGTVNVTVWRVLSDRRLLIFAGCILLFQLANAAMLPMMGSILTMRSSAWASTLIAACIVVPTVIVAAVAPWGAPGWGGGAAPAVAAVFCGLGVAGRALRHGQRSLSCGRRASSRRRLCRRPR